jgi:putative DNA primase/helicase
MAKENNIININQETEATKNFNDEGLNDGGLNLDNEDYLKEQYMNGLININQAIDLQDNKTIPKITIDDTESYNKKFKCTPSKYFEYPLESGDVLFQVVRWDDVPQLNEEMAKEVRPYCFLNGKWKSGVPAGLRRPLYNLLELVARPEATVLIVEGEKTAEASKILFPDYVVTTSSGGANAVAKTNWQVLRGRNILISPDNDVTGGHYATKVKEQYDNLGSCKPVYMLSPEAIGKYTIEKGEIIERQDRLKQGYDLDDALEEGWTSELIKIALDEGKILFHKMAEKIIIKDDRKFDNEEEATTSDPYYKLTAEGLYFLIVTETKEGNSTISKETWHRLCGYIKAISSIRNDDDSDYGNLFEFKNKEGNIKNIIFYQSQLIDDKSALKMLLERGFNVESVKTFRHKALTCDLINRYINSCEPKEKSIVVKKVGWHRNTYIMPRIDNPKNTYSIGNEQPINYIYESAFSNQRRLAIKGTIEEWSEHICKLSSDNNILTFCIASSLASVLLTPLGLDGFCFHLVGGSSIGKTTALYVASSVWGIEKLSSFRATDNAAESLCRNSNDGLIAFDEINETDSDSIEKITYMVGNGFGKARAKKNGEAQDITTFKVLGLSTGEISLKTKLNEKKKNTTAGQAVRFIEIDADQGKKLGIFDTLHDFKSAKDLANHLKEMAAKYHGSSIDGFMKCLVNNFDEFKDRVKMFRKQWLELNTKDIQDGQVERVAGSFALVASVGEVAVQYGTLAFEPQKIAIACSVLFQNWLKKRGGTDSFEFKEIVTRLKRLIQEQANSRFLNADGTDDNKNINIAGYKKLENVNGDNVVTEYWINIDLFDREILENRDRKIFLPQLLKCGYILYDKVDKQYTLRKKPNNENRRRFFVVSANAINESEVEDGRY